MHEVMNRRPARVVPALLVGLVACGACGPGTRKGDTYPEPSSSASEGYYDDKPAKSGAAAPQPRQPGQPGAKGAPQDKVRDRATRLREAGDLLFKAAEFRDQGAKSLAEQYFGFAELITGPDAVADLAEQFRAGAPPRVTEPPKKMEKETPPQPVAVGDSEQETPPEPAPPKKEYANLSGTLQLDGRTPEGDIGVVTLEPAGGGRGKRPLPMPRIMEQRNRTFLPRVLVVPVGSAVTFPNWDPIFHNVFSTSETRPFDLGLYKSGEARTVVFDREGVVKLGCNLHANMQAHIVVVAAPHYAVTGGNGQFSFRRLEPGKYTLRAWNERSSKAVTRELELRPGSNSTAIGLSGDAPKGPSPDKFGVARGGKSP